MSPVEPESSMPAAGQPIEGGRPRRAADPGSRRRRWPWVVGSIVAVVLVLGGAGAWLGVKVLTVRDELTAAQGLVAGLQGGDLTETLNGLAGHGERAVAATEDPLWGVAEHLPWAGDNLRAARLASETLDTLAGGLGVPALTALQSESDDPMLVRLLPVLQEAAPAVHALNADLQQVRDGSLVSQLRGPIDQVAEIVATVDPVLQIVPGMLGAEGERNYLLVAQNNAETMPLGGNAASQTLIHVAASGEVTIAAQADSDDFDNGNPVDVPVDDSAIELYMGHLTRKVMLTTGRPDFPTAARALIAFWQRDIADDQIDGVISIDPLALSKIMTATGPIEIPGWGEVTAENVVKLVLSDMYAMTNGGDASDEAFKVLAVAVFDKLTAGKFDARLMASAISSSIDTGSLMFYSTHEDIQQVVSELRVGGILPTTNDPTTVLGVFFRDASSGSKIDYYLRTETEVTQGCEADGSVTYRVYVTVWLDLSKKKAQTLAPYVIGGDLKGRVFRTQVFIYGPPGTEVTEEFRERGTGTAWNWRPLDMHDLGRPTPSFMTVNALGGDTVTVGVTFTGPPGLYGPLEVRTTPMVHPTEVTLKDTCVR